MNAKLLAPALLSAALSCGAQGVPPEVVEAAVQAVTAADSKLADMTSLPTGASVAKQRAGSDSLWVTTDAGKFKLRTRVQAQFKAALSIPMGSTTSDTEILASLQALASPYQEACAQVKGTLSYYDFGNGPDGNAHRSLLSAYSQGRKAKLIGQHTCEVEGQAVFAFAVIPFSNTVSTFIPPGFKLEMLAWSYSPKDVVDQLGAAKAEADSFARRADELRSSGKPGTEVQVRSDAIQLPNVSSKNGWVCALLIERRDSLMQVQIATTTVFVPAASVVPRVAEDAAKPGLPPPCARRMP